MKKTLAALTLVIGSYAHGDTGCQSKIQKETDSFGGTVYKSSAFVPSIDKNTVFNNVYKGMSSEGWKFAQVDAKLGVINALQDVSYGNGKTAPLNVVIENSQGGSQIVLSFTVARGLMTTDQLVRDGFCKIIRSVG